MYQSAYDLIMQYVFDGVTVTPHIELVTTALATTASIMVVALPFCIVFKLISMLMGR